jgi:tetratricopeptide (TPR) repeat protein
VTYIAQRAESMMSLFYLATLYCLARSAASRKPGLWQACGVTACLLGALTKEAIVTAPVAALLYDRAFFSVSFREALRLRGRFYLGLAVTWIVTGILMGSFGVHPGTIGFSLGQGWWGYLKTQAFAVPHYLRLFIWPSPLVFDYGELWITDLVEVLLPGLAVVGLVAISAIAFWKRPAAGFAGIFFFLVLAPTSSVVPVITTVAEYRVYLALSAPCALLVVAGYAVWRKWAEGRISARKRWAVPAAVLAVVVTAATAATARRNEVYRTEIGLWRDVTEKLPGSDRATYSLGVAYRRVGNLAEAMKYFENAVRLRPGHHQAYNNLGLTYQATGRLRECLEALGKAVALHPDKTMYRMNLGAALTLAGRYEEAIGQLSVAAKRHPEDPSVLSNLGNALWMAGRTAEATDLFRKVVRLSPELPEGRNNLGYALIEQGRASEAVPHLETAARLGPEVADFRYNLGRALLATGDTARAAEQFSIALELNPEDDIVRRYLEQALSAESASSGGK